VVPDEQSGAAAAATVRAIMDATAYLTLATADADGVPWASPVWFAHAGFRELFWVSDPDARHSRNIAERPGVGIVMFDSQVPIGTGRGVYLRAIAAEVRDDDLDRGLAIFSQRSREQGGRSWTAADVRPPARHRLYRALVREHHLGGRDDRRTPVDLDADRSAS
jgi:nitroimidazol reductase NimA-like FMN-containing flavoprotein (pyridoxamine 5'-phosphate oxidase superfamily)